VTNLSPVATNIVEALPTEEKPAAAGVEGNKEAAVATNAALTLVEQIDNLGNTNKEEIIRCK